MNTNEATIHRFYSAFAQLDYETMQDCYADNAIFTDPVFKGLNSGEVKAMWEMLCKGSKNFRLEFKNIKADDRTGSADWTAHYTFSATNKSVVNHIHASFVLENGKIVSHKDVFDFHKWARQALGLSGYLLGGTKFLNNKVSEAGAMRLKEFMAKKE